MNSPNQAPKTPLVDETSAHLGLDSILAHDWNGDGAVAAENDSPFSDLPPTQGNPVAHILKLLSRSEMVDWPHEPLPDARAAHLAGRVSGLHAFYNTMGYANDTIQDLSTLGGSHRAIESTMVDSQLNLAESMVGAARWQEFASKDQMTGLYRREVLLEVYDRLSAEHSHRRGDTDVPFDNSLVLLDMDHFKGINDVYGHIAGDRALKYLSEIIQESIRERDIAARVGGEEFMIILPRANEEGAVKLAERIRHRVENELASRMGIENDRLVTVSIGVRELDMHISFEENSGAADAALYLAKSNGRNQTVTAAAALGNITKLPEDN